jgi:hypothetical protein
MIDTVFPITGKKLSAFIVDEQSLLFSSQRKNSFDAFKEEYAKKITLATKHEVKYEEIISITKEETEFDLHLSYKGTLGITNELEFTFSNAEDYEVFLTYLEHKRYFTRTYETLSPFNAIRSQLIWFFLSILGTIYFYDRAIEIAKEGVDDSARGRFRLINYLLELLGDKGIIAVGAIVVSYLGYNIWKRYSNPPRQMRLMPPNAN